MDPKSASETKTMTEEASKEQETKTTESMEMADSSVKKRKAEEDASDSEYASDPEEDGEDGEMEVENEAGKEGSSSSDDIPEWGVDSFDGAEYESPDDDDKYLSDEEANLKARRYLRQIHETRGFEVDRELIPKCIGGYHQVNLDGPFLHGLTGRRYMEDMAKLCLEKYNQIEGKSVECDHIVRAVYRSNAGVVSHITFMAREKPGYEELVEYQAKTIWKVWNKDVTHLIFCRKASEANDATNRPRRNRKYKKFICFV